MSDFMSHYAVPVAIGAVAIVLVLGLINMMRGGSPNTLAEADAAARAAAIRRHRRHHGDDLDHGADCTPFRSRAAWPQSEFGRRGRHGRT